MNNNDHHHITALEFDSTSNYLAVGYSNGAIVVLKLLLSNWNKENDVNNGGPIQNGKHKDDKDDYHSDDYDNNDDNEIFPMDIDDDEISHFKKNTIHLNNNNKSKDNNHDEILYLKKRKYKVLVYFQAHDTQIIQIQWCKGYCSSLLLVSTSVSNTILWKVSEFSNGKMKLNIKKSFENEQIFNINSISLNSDGNTFLSSDELRVYLWDLNHNQDYLNIIDIKPNNFHFLNEIIRVTEFHPILCNLVIYGTSRGIVRLCDMRTSALVKDSKTYEIQSSPSVYSDYVNSILDLKFSFDGQYFVSRNLGSLNLWDIRDETKPISSHSLYQDTNNQFQTKLFDMYEAQASMDKFQCKFLPDNKSIITGSYDNKSLVWNPFNNSDIINSQTPLIFESSFNMNHTEQIEEEIYYIDQENIEFKLLLDNSQNNEIELDYNIRSMNNDKLLKLYNYTYIRDNYKNIHFQNYKNNISQLVSNNNNNKLTISNPYNKISCISTSHPASNRQNTQQFNIIATSTKNQLFLYNY